VRIVLAALFLRPLLRSPGRFLITILGVAVGVAAMVATVAASRAAVSSLEEGVVEIAGRSRLEITRPGGVPVELLAELRNFCYEARIVPVLEEIALLPELGDTVRILGLDLLVDRASRSLRAGTEEQDGSGELPRDLRDRVLRGTAALVPEPLALRLGKKVGDEVEILVRSKSVRLPIADIPRWETAGQALDATIVVDIALAQELTFRTGRLDRIEIVPREGADVADLERRLRAAMPHGVVVSSPEERGDRTTRMVSALRFNLTALSGISLLVGAVLVATTLATSVVQRRMVIARLRSVGASSFQILAAVVVEAACVGLLGGVVGVLLGGTGARAALPAVRSSAAVVVPGAPLSKITVGPLLAASGVLCGLLVALAAAVVPAREALRTPPVQLLSGEAPSFLTRREILRSLLFSTLLGGLAALLVRLPAMGDLPVAALLGALALLFSLVFLATPLLEALGRVGGSLASRAGLLVARLAAASLLAGRRRAAWALGAVGMAVALAVSVATMVDSFRTTVVDWSEQSLRADLWVRPLVASTGVTVGGLSPDVVERTRGLFGTGAVDPFHRRGLVLEGRSIVLGAGAFDVVARRGGVPYLSGRDSREVLAEARRRGGAVVNEPFSRKFGLGRGDVVELPSPLGSIRREIVDVFYEYGDDQGMVVIDLEDYLSVYPDDGPKDLRVYLDADAGVEEARRRLREALTGYAVEVLDNRELKTEILAIFDRTFAITTALRTVSFLVAVIAVIAVLSALVQERRRDIAVLRALGASRWTLLGLSLLQATGIGALSSILGLGFGLLVGLILVFVVNLQSFGWSLRFLVPWDFLASSAAWVLGACLLAGIVPALRAMRVEIKEALEAE